MMFRPEHLQSEHLDLTLYTDFGNAYQDETSKSPVKSLEVDNLVERLTSENLTSSKRAVIEQLVALWAAESKLDVA